MDFDSVKAKFLDLTQQIQDDSVRDQFFTWMRDMMIPEFEKSSTDVNGVRDSEERLLTIASDIRAQMPMEAILPSEKIRFPTTGEDSKLNATNSIHIDAFLYDEDEEDVLVQQGLLSRNFCGDCGSRNIEDLTFVTHSCSKERLEIMFKKLLPPLDNTRTVVDIGSRVGAVLYGAYFYTQASKIIGIEINSDLCSLQRAMVEKHGLKDRIQVLEGDMCGMGETIRTGDVVILNNVFDWFMAPEVQVQLWQFLRATLSPGSLLVTIPSLETSLEHLDTGIDLDTWVTQLSGNYGAGAGGGDDSDDDDMDVEECEESEMCLYQILGS